MLKRTLVIAALVISLVAVGVAYLFFKPTEEASAPIQAIPLAQSTATGAGATPATPAASSGVEPQQTEAPAVAAQPLVFEIVQSESEARFIIDEVLRGAPKTVVGTTDQVAGQIAVDPADPSATRIGTILINARTLTTDEDMRNRAIKNRILFTDEFEYITFEPTAINDLPDVWTVGERYTFQVVGDLTVTDVTRPVTFEVTVQSLDGQRLEGLAVTTIRYADFGLSIPRVPAVASVAEEVRLELQFAAVPNT